MSSPIPLSSMELEIQSEGCQQTFHSLDYFHPSLATQQLYPLDSESSDAKDLFNMQLETQSEHSQPKPSSESQTPSPFTAKKALFTNPSPSPSSRKRPYTPGASYPFSPSPKVTKTDVEKLSSRLSNFKEDLDINLKAVLYSLIVGKTNVAREGLERVKRRSIAFFSQSMFEMKNIEAKTMALNHKIALLEKRNLHLYRQKNELQTKIQTLEQQKLMTDQYDVPTSFFEEEFGEDNKTA